MRVNAEYHDALLPEHKGNPLIEALPPKAPINEILSNLAHFPTFSDEERKLPAFEREEYLERLKSLVMPLTQYEPCYRYIRRAVVSSYATKNPFSPTTRHYLHYLDANATAVAPKTGLFQSNGCAISVIGLSGTGKSKMIEQILQCFPQVIEHQEYKGDSLSLDQLVWLKIDCPSNASLRGLCHSILDEMDTALGLPETKPARTLDALQLQVQHRLRSSFVGTLAIDELQNLGEQLKVNGKLLIKFLLNLINKSGVAVILSGNPEVTDWLLKKFRLARRAEAGGYIDMTPIDPDFWPVFAGALWRLQWTNEDTPLTTELSKLLYDLSAGLPEIAVRIYREAQDMLLGNGDERISPIVLYEACDRACPLTRDQVQDIRRSQEVAANRGSQPQEEACCTPTNRSRLELIGNSADTPGSLLKPQHTEFVERISELQALPSIASEISQPGLLRGFSGQGDAALQMREHELIIENPLNDL